MICLCWGAKRSRRCSCSVIREQRTHQSEDGSYLARVGFPHAGQGFIEMPLVDVRSGAARVSRTLFAYLEDQPTKESQVEERARDLAEALMDAAMSDFGAVGYAQWEHWRTLLRPFDLDLPTYPSLMSGSWPLGKYLEGT